MQRRQRPGPPQIDIRVRLEVPHPGLPEPLKVWDFRATVKPNDSPETRIRKAMDRLVESEASSILQSFPSNFHPGLWMQKFWPLVGQMQGSPDPIEWRIVCNTMYRVWHACLRKYVPKIQASSGETPVLEILRERVQRQVERLSQLGWERLIEEKARTQGRVIVGLGQATVLETGITLHRTFGIPYIPGTSLKGLLRHAALVEMWENHDWRFPDPKNKNEVEKLSADIQEALTTGDGKHLHRWLSSDNAETRGQVDEAVRRIFTVFGGPEQRGLITCLDAYPLEFQWAPDVMNPHYPRYYRGEANFPEEWDSPTPVAFMAIENACFDFVILGDRYRWKRLRQKEKVSWSLDEGEDSLKTWCQRWLKRVWEDLGLGAKTRSGYGYFQTQGDLPCRAPF